MMISGALFKDMILTAASILEKSKEDLNSLNVFPVPDGDTGTNMSLTMMSAVKEIKSADPSNISKLGAALSLGALKGARGNSGVILSQIFRGFAKGLDGLADAQPIDFAKAMQEGVDAAYKAVMKPKEGTILTVAKDMAMAALRSAKSGDDIETMMEKVIEQGADTLRRTPQMLPVLKEAGVVDAGGKGLLVIYRGFKMALDGETVTEGMDYVEDYSEAHADFSELNLDIEFAYCTEFFITKLDKDLKQEDIDRYRDKLSGIGDSIVVVGDLDLIKTHVHTNAPGKALQYALRFGELSKIKIDNMKEQHTELRGGVHEEVEKKNMAIVTVASGEGIMNIFKEFLVDEIVSGGQTMNPSAETIAKAIEKAHSDNVFVFPNNKNIILAAEQAAELSGKNVVVIPSVSLPQGITGVLAYNPELDFEENKQRINKAITTVKTGQVTSAVRASNISGKNIKKGDFIGIDDGQITNYSEDILTTCHELLDGMITEDDSIVTIFYGDEVKKEDAEEMAAQLEEKYQDIDVELQYGGQPVYYYIFAVE